MFAIRCLYRLKANSSISQQLLGGVAGRGCLRTVHHFNTRGLPSFAALQPLVNTPCRGMSSTSAGSTDSPVVSAGTKHRTAEDQELFETMIKLENKEVFVDLKKNSKGVYLKLSERKGRFRHSVLIPSSGIGRLQSALDEILVIDTSSNNIRTAEEQDLFGTMIKMENKVVFVDLKKNSNGVYLKISERNGKHKDTVIIPSSEIGRLNSVLDEILAISTTSNNISPEVVSRSVHVSGLACATTSETLAAHFAQAGCVVKASVLTKTYNGTEISLGCGVVEFASSEEAALAVNSLSNSELEGRAIECREASTMDHAGNDSPTVRVCRTPSASS